MTDFAGYMMPIQYSGIQEEHMAVRQKAGLFDVSHMGEFMVEGEDALAVLQKITTNNVKSLKIGQAQYTLMTNEEGGIIDDLIIYRLDEQKYLMVVNASNIKKDWDWLIENKTLNCRTENVSEQTGLIALQGPKAIQILKRLTDSDIESLEYYHCMMGQVAGASSVLISATGYTGSGGFELYINSDQLVSVWNDIWEIGQQEGLQLAGLGCRDTLRLEMGYCLYGNDIDETTSPLEAGLGWVTKLKKTDFIGQSALIKQKEKGVVRKLIGFKMDGKRVARSGYNILDGKGKVVGEVRSGTFSPCLQTPIGLGYIPKDYEINNKRITISNGRKNFDAEIVKTPFINVNEYGN
ncbi:glycine cleavage system aminomethyltransferase GcvT [Membranihabitans marinus]